MMKKFRILSVLLLLMVSTMLSACSLPGFDFIKETSTEDVPEEVIDYDPIGEWGTYSINGLNWVLWQYFKFDEDHVIYYKNEMTRGNGTVINNNISSEYSFPDYTYYGQWTTTENTLTMLIYGEYYTYNIVTNIGGTPGTGFYVNRPNSEELDCYQGVLFWGGQARALFMRINHS